MKTRNRLADAILKAVRQGVKFNSNEKKYQENGSIKKSDLSINDVRTHIGVWFGEQWCRQN